MHYSQIIVSLLQTSRGVLFWYLSVLFSLNMFVVVFPVCVFFSLSPSLVCLLFGCLFPIPGSCRLTVLSLKFFRHGSIKPQIMHPSSLSADSNWGTSLAPAGCMRFSNISAPIILLASSVMLSFKAIRISSIRVCQRSMRRAAEICRSYQTELTDTDYPATQRYACTNYVLKPMLMSFKIFCIIQSQEAC